MRGRRLAVLALIAGAYVDPCLASSCGKQRSTCQAFAEADRVFIGRVESVEPALDIWGWSPAARKFVKELKAKYGDFEDEFPPVLVIKEIYLRYLPDRYRDSVLRANTEEDIGKIGSELIKAGFRITLSMQKAFKGNKQATIDLSGEMMGCNAYHMRPGETYLVYASSDDKERFTLGGRTRKLSEAGEDLAYLHFVEYGGPSGRLYGFVTSSDSALKEMPRRWHDVPDPAPNLQLLLERDNTVRLTETNEKGGFIFDGLAGGEYRLTLLIHGDPDKVDPSLTRRVIMREQDCVEAELYVSKAALARK